jgi:hypothetical protein
MGLNMRALVRGSINAVNNDIQIGWLASSGSTTNATTGDVTPTYAALQKPWAQIQPLSTQALAHLDNLGIQGVLRKVYLKGAVASCVREDGTGGDLLQFAETPGGPLRTWLVVLVDEQWPEWCRVTAQMQNDNNFAQIVAVLATGAGNLIITGPGQPIQANPNDS